MRNRMDIFYGRLWMYLYICDTVGDNCIVYFHIIRILDMNSVSVWTLGRCFYLDRININIVTIVKSDVKLGAVLHSNSFHCNIGACEKPYGLTKQH